MSTVGLGCEERRKNIFEECGRTQLSRPAITALYFTFSSSLSFSEMQVGGIDNNSAAAAVRYRFMYYAIVY